MEANLVGVTEELCATHFDTNVKGLIVLTNAAEPHLLRGGRVVFVSLTAACLGVPGQTVYAATKGANEALIRVWAKELGQSHDITVNCVKPGPVATGKARCLPRPRPPWLCNAVAMTFPTRTRSVRRER